VYFSLIKSMKLQFINIQVDVLMYLLIAITIDP
jgi:hypothetical protein